MQLEEDGIMFVGERERFRSCGYSEEHIQEIYNARVALRLIMRNKDSEGVTAFTMPYEEIAKCFPLEEVK
jgi:hypothetical protein